MEIQEKYKSVWFIAIFFLFILRPIPCSFKKSVLYKILHPLIYNILFLKKMFFAPWGLIVVGYQFCPLAGDQRAPDLGSTWLWSGIPWLRPVTNFMLLSHFTQLYEHELTFLAHILYTENKKDFLWKHLFLNFFIYLPLLSKFSFCGDWLVTPLYLH